MRILSWEVSDIRLPIKPGGPWREESPQGHTGTLCDGRTAPGQAPGRRRKRCQRSDKAEDFTAATLQSAEGLLMTPRRTGTDGFFVSVLRKT